MPSVDHEAREVSCSEFALDYGSDKLSPQPKSCRAEADQVATGVLAERIVYSSEETVPKPRVIFIGDIGRVVWRMICRWRCEKYLRWTLAENREELRAGIRWKGDVWYGG